MGLRAGRPLHAMVGPRPALRLERRVPAGCQSCVANTSAPRAAKAAATAVSVIATPAPVGTGSAPPGQKSFCTSTTIRASVLVNSMWSPRRAPSKLVQANDTRRGQPPSYPRSGYPPGVGVFFSPSLNRATTRRHAKILVGVASCSSRSTRAQATITCSSMGAMATAIGRSSLDARRTATSALAPTGSSWRPAPVAPPVRMRIFNADGSEGEMCGNGIRCFAKFTIERGIVPGGDGPLDIETKAGVLSVVPSWQEGRVVGALVDMGEPILTAGDVPVDPSQGARATTRASTARSWRSLAYRRAICSSTPRSASMARRSPAQPCRWGIRTSSRSSTRPFTTFPWSGRASEPSLSGIRRSRTG